MKQIYIAYYKNGHKGPTKVLGTDEASAKKAALVAYRYMSSMANPGWSVDEVVERVELDPDQTMSGFGIQPCVQIPCRAPGSESYLPEGVYRKASTL